MQLNWFNYRYINVDGYGRMGLHLVKALLELGHDVQPYLAEELDFPDWMLRAKGINFDRPSVQLMPPHNMKEVPGRSLGYSMHESMKLPSGWAEHVNAKCHRLVVPSKWLVDVFQDAGVKMPIDVVPGGIDPDECKIIGKKKSSPFTFGCLADRGTRKGYDLVWSAFYKAFDANNSDVRLLIKCRPGSLDGLSLGHSPDHRLNIWKQDVTSMVDVFAHMDAFMFPSRCEGYGMPPREASACGVPTVVTRWSGTADDVDEWAFPLNDFTLVESDMIGSGGLWAQPSLDEIVWRMRDIYEKQDEYKAKAQEHAKWLRENATYQHAAQKLVTVIKDWLVNI